MRRASPTWLLLLASAAFAVLLMNAALWAQGDTAEATDEPAAVTATGAPARAAGTYVVEAGDTFDTIGAANNVSVACLIENNPELENPNRIFPGDTLTLSGCPPYEGFDAPINPRSQFDDGTDGQGGGAADDRPQPAPGDDTYIVQRGDTFDSIAAELDISVIALLVANGSPQPDEIFIGDTIIIPAGAPPYGAFPPLTEPYTFDGTVPELGQGGGGANAGPGDTVYVVQPLDVLDLIAATYNRDVQCLIEQNNLDQPNFIFPGQTLVLAASCPPYTGASFVRTPNAAGAIDGAGSTGRGGGVTTAETAQPTATQPAPTGTAATAQPTGMPTQEQIIPTLTPVGGAPAVPATAIAPEETPDTFG